MAEPENPPQNLIANTPLVVKVQEVKNLIVGAVNPVKCDRLYESRVFGTVARPDCVRDLYIKRELDKLASGGIKVPKFITGVYKAYLDATMKDTVTYTLPCSGVSRKMFYHDVAGSPYLGFSHFTALYKASAPKVDGKSAFIVVNLMPLVPATGVHLFRSFMGTVERSRAIALRSTLLPGKYAVAVHGFYSGSSVADMGEEYKKAVNYCLAAPIQTWDMISDGVLPTVVTGKSANPEVVVDDLLSNKKIANTVVDSSIDLFDTGLTDAGFKERISNFTAVEDKLIRKPEELEFDSIENPEIEIFVIDL